MLCIHNIQERAVKNLKSTSLYKDSTEIGAAVFALRISLVRLTCFFNLAIALGD